jgi:hypothetical protein
MGNQRRARMQYAITRKQITMWARVVNALLGIWLMVAPEVLGYGGIAASNHRIVGPIAASFAVVAIWEATRPLRWVNLALGLWLVVSPLVLGGAAAASITSLVVGVLLWTMALARGRVTQQFGGGWSALWRSADGRQQDDAGCS